MICVVGGLVECLLYWDMGPVLMVVGVRRVQQEDWIKVAVDVHI